MLPKNPTVDDIRGLSQPNPSPAAIGARAWHMSMQMNDLPNTYKNLLPTTDDPKALQEAEEAIRFIHAADRQAHADLNAPPRQEVDVAKMKPCALIEHAIRQNKPAGVQQPPAAPTAFGSPGLSVQPVKSAPPQQKATLSKIANLKMIEEALRGGPSNAGRFFP